ncbi:response regulator transcription factor [Olivibacter domesticus]|uniref:Two component transcriptional regulator, LuxR family n=1 Tax=Olivibacter domesticus TaxID=407022 RepID=A0A1H7KIA8_OLID1|nr:response regulator transcription factor [Olivibacter domesticus]SEK85657.1 two component transcriptional regulator, LuxR family [Olivibacter domesticus]
MINIILVDDHYIVRQGVRTLLETESDLTIIGETDQQSELIQLLESDQPIDVIMMDITMPGVDGITLTTAIKSARPQLHIIILSMMDHVKYVTQAFEAGADAYLVKNVSRDELLFAIKHVAEGNQYICSEISMKLLSQATNTYKQPLAVEVLDLHINNREMEVLALTADGFTNQEIAERLFTSKRTVEGYRQSLIEKTGVRNSAALVKFAFQNGLLT